MQAVSSEPGSYSHSLYNFTRFQKNKDAEGKVAPGLGRVSALPLLLRLWNTPVWLSFGDPLLGAEYFHMLMPQSLLPQNMTEIGNGAFKDMIQLK